MSPDYSMWVLEYCRVPEQPADIVWGGKYRAGETIDFPFPVIILQGGGKTIMFESGLDFEDEEAQQIAEMYGVKDLHQMPELLAEIGMKPEDIDYVIPSHGHWDHMGGINFFPNAQIVLQKDDFFGWLEAMAKPDRFDVVRGPMIMKHFHRVLDAIEEGRVTFLDGPVKNFLPGIDIEVDYEGHSFASTILVVHNVTNDGESDDYLLAGDIIYATSNVFGVDGIPGFIPCTAFNVGSTWQTLNTYERMYQFADGDPSRLIPTHDYEHWVKYPTKTLPSGMRFAEIRLAEGAKSLLD